ncbi:hypothetical protein FHG87_002157 [Trinorchestia longiramus]|nr:hypothetical protein FHG87_002157 [Trinorchestia longiramus]
MDNFTGLFPDGDLGDLDLGVDSFGGPPGPTPVSVSDLDLGNYSQPSYTNIGSNPEQQQQQGQSQQPQKASHLSGPQQQPPQQLQPPGGGGPGQPGFGVPPQGYQYGPSGGGAAQQQPPMGQFNMGNQFRPPYHSQDIYGQASMPGWGASPDPFSGPPSQPGFSMPGGPPGGRQMREYQGGPMQGMPNSLPPSQAQQQPSQPSNIPQNYSGIPPGHSLPPQGYQTQQGPYSTGPRPPYPGYDPQRSLAPGSSMMYSSGPHGQSGGPLGPGGPHSAGPMGPSGPHGPGAPQQAYGVRPGAQQPQQYTSFSQPGAPQMMPGHGAPSEMSRQFSNTQHPQAPSHQMPNGSPAYRPSYTPSAPQMSPHSQMSPHPQMSPRSMSSPHPTSSPVPNQSSASSISGPTNIPTSSSGGAGSSLQHLENMVKPSMGAPTSSAPQNQSLQSSMYSGPSGIPSPISNRAPMSPGLSRPVGPPMSPVMSPRPPMSPQQWGSQARPPSQGYNIQPGYHPGMSNPRGAAPTITQLSVAQENMHAESIASASDSSKLTSNCGNVNSAAQLNGPLLNVSVNTSNINTVVSDSVKDRLDNQQNLLNINGPVSGKLSIPANVPHSTSAMPAVDSGLSSVTSAAVAAPSSIPNPSVGGVQQQQPTVHVPPNSVQGNTATGGLSMGAVASAPNGMMSHRPPGSMPPQCGPYQQQFRMSGSHQYRPGSPLNTLPHHQGLAPRSMVSNISQPMMSQALHASNSQVTGMNISVASNVNTHQIGSMVSSQMTSPHMPCSPQGASGGNQQHFNLGMSDLPSHSSHNTSLPIMNKPVSASTVSSPVISQQLSTTSSGGALNVMSQGNLQGPSMMCSSPLQLQQSCESPQQLMQDSSGQTNSFLQSGSPSANTVVASSASPLTPNSSSAEAMGSSPMGAGMSSSQPGGGIPQVSTPGSSEHSGSSPHHMRPNSCSPMVSNPSENSSSMQMGGPNQRSFAAHGNMGFGSPNQMGPGVMRPNTPLGMQGGNGAPRAPSPCGSNGSPGMPVGPSPIRPSTGPGVGGQTMIDPLRQSSSSQMAANGSPQIRSEGPSILRPPSSQMTSEEMEMGSGSSPARPSVSQCQMGVSSPVIPGSPQMNQGSPVPIRPAVPNQPNLGGPSPLGPNGPGPMNMGGPATPQGPNGQMPPGSTHMSPHPSVMGPGVMMPNIPPSQMGPGMRPVGPAMIGPRGPGMTGMIPHIPGHPMQPPSNLTFELQQCQQQLQQLYKMPQNMQTQQQINDIQQRINQLQQQQQQFMQSQSMFGRASGQFPDVPVNLPVKERLRRTVFAPWYAQSPCSDLGQLLLAS